MYFSHDSFFHNIKESAVKTIRHIELWNYFPKYMKLAENQQASSSDSADPRYYSVGIKYSVPRLDCVVSKSWLEPHFKGIYLYYNCEQISAKEGSRVLIIKQSLAARIRRAIDVIWGLTINEWT